MRSVRYGLWLLVGMLLFTGCLERNTLSPKKTEIQSHNPLVKEALKQLGKPYLYGAIGPDYFDCSGFVYAMAKRVGIALPRTALAQSQIAGKKLSRAEIREGDLLFFDTALRGRVNHVGIYLGNDRFIHASSGKAHGVTISSLNGWYRDKFRWGKHLR